MALSNTERSRLAREKKKLAGPALQGRAESLQPVAPRGPRVVERAVRVTRAEFEREVALRRAQEARLVMVEDEMAAWARKFGAPGLVAQTLDPITALKRQLETVGKDASRAEPIPGMVPMSPPVFLPHGYNPLLSEPMDREDFTSA